MFRELFEKAIRQVIPPKPSPRFDKFVEDLSLGEVPEIEQYNERSQIDHFGTNERGDEVVVVTTPVMD